MRKTLIFINLSCLFVLSFNSCKRKIYGCTNFDAINHSSSANTDDGSCILSSEINTEQQRIFIENFNITFSNQSFYSYDPAFNYENGDLILVEILSDFGSGESYWSTLPFTNIGSDVTIWQEYSQSFGTIYIYSTTINNANTYTWLTNPTISFRAVLIKKDALIENPNLPNLTYEELINLM